MVEDARSAGHAGILPPVGVVNVSVAGQRNPENWSVADELLGAASLPMLFPTDDARRRVPWLFCAQAAWQYNSAVVRHRKLWKNIAARYDLSKLQLAEEVCIESAEGIRYASVALVRNDVWISVCKMLRRLEPAAIIMSDKQDISTSAEILSLFNAMFPPNNGVNSVSINWANLAIKVCGRDDVLIRGPWPFDEHLSSMDFYVPAGELVSFLAKCPGNDRPNGTGNI